MLKETRPFEKEPVLVQIFFGDFLKFLPFLNVFLGPLQYLTFLYIFSQSQIICESQALMGYQSVNLQSGYFSDLNASIPYPVEPQVELPATSLFHLAPVFSLKVP